MSDLVGNPEDRFSQNEAQIGKSRHGHGSCEQAKYHLPSNRTSLSFQRLDDVTNHVRQTLDFLLSNHYLYGCVR